MNSQTLQTYYQLARASSLFKAFYAPYNDYSDAPRLDKKTLTGLLKAHFNLQQESKGVYLVRSGGSTQKPLVFPVDIAENMEQRAALAKALASANVFTPGTIALNMFGYADMYRTAAIFDDLLEKCNATTLALSASVPYADAYETALHFKPNFILGTPSKLFLFARHLQKKQQALQIQNLLFGGEFLLPSYEPVFKEIFGTQHIYALYGSAETGIWAWSDYSVNPSLFSMIDGLVVEIAEADANGYGNILVTNLFRKRFPVFRYDSGDVGRLVTKNGIQFLELRAREKKSFTLYESNYSLDDFETVLQDANQFQVQLSTNTDLHVEVRFLLVTDLPEGLEREQFARQKHKQIEDVLGYPLRHLTVEAGPDLHLYTDAVTGKTPLIADFRK